MLQIGLHVHVFTMHQNVISLHSLNPQHCRLYLIELAIMLNLSVKSEIQIEKKHHELLSCAIHVHTCTFYVLNM